jgi:uncharacterized protein with GYD domain
MATYVMLMKYTDQGIRKIKDSPKRAEAFREAAKKSGVTVKDILWTQGHYDIVTILEAPDDHSLSAVVLGVGALGNVHTETLRAYSAADMKAILAKMS